MRNLLLLITISTILMAGSCGNDPQIEFDTNVKLNFNANYDSELFLLENEYTYPGDMPIKFSQFNFYISNISLIKENAGDIEETEVIEIDFVDFPFRVNEIAQAQAGISIQANNIPVGSYDGIKISFGVPADFNRTVPNDYGSSDPLSMASHYWSAWNSYIFSKIEATADVNNNGEFETNSGEGITYHIGTDETYTTRTIFQPINLVKDQVTELKFNVDVKKLFINNNPTYDANNDGFIDVQTHQGTHTDAQLVLAKRIMNNYSEAISLED